MPLKKSIFVHQIQMLRVSLQLIIYNWINDTWFPSKMAFVSSSHIPFLCPQPLPVIRLFSFTFWELFHFVVWFYILWWKIMLKIRNNDFVMWKSCLLLIHSASDHVFSSWKQNSKICNSINIIAFLDITFSIALYLSFISIVFSRGFIEAKSLLLFHFLCQLVPY